MSAALEVGMQRFATVTVPRTPPQAGAPLVPLRSTLPAQIDQTNVRTLTDDEVLHLLEDHARRVIENDALLIAPVEIFFLPRAAIKMKHGAQPGGLLPTMNAEALFLEGWVAEKVTHHQIPKMATIAKVLGPQYGVLKTRSRAANRKSKS